MEAGNTLLDDYVLGLAGRSARRSASSPPPAATPTTTWCASTAHFGAARRPRTSRSSAATTAPSNFREHLLDQDIIYVGGGCVLSLLGVWGAHGIDTILREAWERGVILCGVSAGSLCWFTEGVTAFHGARAALHGPRHPARGATPSTTTPSAGAATSSGASSSTG